MLGRALPLQVADRLEQRAGQSPGEGEPTLALLLFGLAGCSCPALGGRHVVLCLGEVDRDS